MSNKNDHDTYIIPPNFIETGTFFGGMFRARNVIEAGILVFAIGMPVFLFLPFGLTTRIIILCLTALPVGLVALIGISGESLSQFLVIFLKYLRNRRVVGGDGEQPEEKAAPSKSAGKHLKQRPPKEKKPKAPKRRRSGEADFPAEFDEVRGYEIREKLRPKKNPKKERPAKANKAKKKAKKRPEKERLPKRPAHAKEQKPACLNPVADYLPIEKVENGIIYTKDHRFVKVVEVVPINFMLRSAREQRNIIYSFVSYLKISPVKLQIKVLTRRADINRHLDTVRREMAHEENEQCRLMQEDYLNFVQQVGSREAVTRRFFLIFEYEPWANTRRSEQEDEAIQSLQSAVHTASNYLRQCGNEVIVPENEDEFTVDVLYNLLCRNESAVKPLSVRAQEVVAQYMEHGRESEIDHIPAAEFAAPRSIDFSHGRYVTMDNAGIGLFQDEKPKVFSPQGYHGEATEYPAFYSSREVKEMGIDATQVRSSRFAGVLLAPTGIFVTYNSGAALMKWRCKSEIRVKALMWSVLCQQRLAGQYRAEDVHGLVLGDSMELAYQMLTSTGGAKHDYFMLDGSYDHFYFLTNNHQGEVILALLCDPLKTAELNRILSQGLITGNAGRAIEQDAAERDGTPVLFGYFCDLPRIARFNTVIPRITQEIEGLFGAAN